MNVPLGKGTLHIATDVFTAIAGYAATHCFGVKGMAARNMQDGIVQLLRREYLARGVKIIRSPRDSTIDVELHIVVDHGINIPEVCRSIMNEVRYNVERLTGVTVNAVNICVDSIMLG